MGSYGLPNNTPTTPAGTNVKPPAKWLGTIVTAVSDGKGNTFPVPKGFYYVGGNYDNGVIISDDPADAYDGITDKTTWEYTTNLVGNQFVWIPCTTDEYHKTDWGSTYVYGGYDGDTPARAEVMQVQKYEGFYVARYEAGLADTIIEYTGNQICDASNSTGYNVQGIPKSKAGQLPWIFINYTNSKKNAEDMYGTNDYVISGLITGTQWDVMLNKFIGKTNESGITITIADITDSSRWGNYYNNNLTYTGRSATLNTNGSSWWITPWGDKKIDEKTGNNIRTVFTTGASKTTEVYHTYDVAGNMWEWTEEVGQGTNYRVNRSGYSYSASNAVPACLRYGSHLDSRVDYSISFRIVLYIN